MKKISGPKNCSKGSTKTRKKRKRKVLYTVLIVIAVIVAALVLLVLSLRHKVEQQFASAAAEVQSHTVQTGTISTLVSGSGILTQEDLEQLTVPAGVEITEVLVESGDTVKQGDLLATVDMATVMTALSDAQDQLDELDSDIADAKGDTVKAEAALRYFGQPFRPGEDPLCGA